MSVFLCLLPYTFCVVDGTSFFSACNRCRYDFTNSRYPFFSINSFSYGLSFADHSPVIDSDQAHDIIIFKSIKRLANRSSSSPRFPHSSSVLAMHLLCESSFIAIDQGKGILTSTTLYRRGYISGGKYFCMPGGSAFELTGGRAT